MSVDNLAQVDGQVAAVWTEKVFKNVQLINVFTGEILPTDLAVHGGKVVGWGNYQGREEIDLAGRYICPGFIDGHVHLESSLVVPAEFARAVVPLGTTTVIADPHEIANVCGLDGIRYLMEATAFLPLDVFFMLPSAVPSTALETGGAVLTASDLCVYRSHPRVLGLGEVMDYNAVLAERPGIMDKLNLFRGMVTDGHAPKLTGTSLHRYIAAGIGSDHECTTEGEAWEKLSLGMHIMLRESSACQNLLALLPAVTPITSRRCMFVTDDRHPSDLRDEGHINYLVRRAVAAGVEAIVAIQMATINTAQYFGLHAKGALAPGYDADFLVLENLSDFRPLCVFQRGIMVATGGELVATASVYREPALEQSINAAPLRPEQLQLYAEGPLARVIGLVPNQIATLKLELAVPISDGCYVADVARDVLKLAVVERHFATGQVGVGLVHGFGLKKGAIASSVAHDSHNLVVIGTNDADMETALAAIIKLGGGIALVQSGEVLASLALPVAGLMSLKSLEEVAAELSKLCVIACELGVRPGSDPFMTLSFLALPVVPELKLTSRGLVDVGTGQIVPCAVNCDGVAGRGGRSE